MSSFWWGADLGELFFSGLRVENALAMAGACFAFVVLSVLLEGLKTVEMKWHSSDSNADSRGRGRDRDSDRNSLLDGSSIEGETLGRRMSRGVASYLNSCKGKPQRVLMFTTKTSLNYFIMLAVMLFNGYIFLSVVIGMILGNFIFGFIRSTYNMQKISSKRRSGMNVRTSGSDPNDPNSTPPLLQVEDSNETVENVCRVQINSNFEDISSGSAAARNTTFEDEEPIVFRHESTPRKTNDASKIKGSKAKIAVERAEENGSQSEQNEIESNVTTTDT